MGLLLAAGMSVAAQPDCSSLVLPVNEDFDSYGTASLPSCWYASRNYDLGQPPHITHDQHSSGTSSLVLYPGTLAGSHYSIVIAPPLAVDNLDGIQARFRMMAASTAARLEVGFCVDTLRYSRAFTPIDTFHVDQAMRWQEVALDLGQYQGDGRRLAFRMQRGMQNDAAECYIDDLRLEACGVSNPRAVHIGGTSLTLVFDRYGMGDVQVAYGDTVIGDAVSPLEITGLQPLTPYVFTIGCAGGVTHTVNATTLEEVGMVPAYYEPFASGLPTGWRFPAGAAPTVSDRRLRLAPTGSNSCVAVLPLQEAAATQDLNIALLLSGTGTTQLVVGVMEYAAEPESFVAVDTLVCTAAEQQHVVSLAPYAGNGRYIALTAIGNGTVRVGEVRVARCLLGSPHLYNLTDREVTVAWDTLALTAAVQLEYGARGFAPGSGTLVYPSSNPFTLDELDMGTDYDMYLWPACGDSLCSYDLLTFTTFAHRVTPPYCTDFEESATLPQGWVGSGATISANSYSGSRALRLAAGGHACLPLLDTTSADTLSLEFYATGSGPLAIGTAPNAYAAPTVQSTVSGGGWQRHSVQLTSTSGRCISLQGTGVWTIDALTLHSATIEAASVHRIGQTAALLDWQLTGDDSVNVEYKAVASGDADFTEGTGLLLTAADSLWLEGLHADTFYTVYLRPASDAAGCYPTVLHFQTMADSVALPLCENYEGIATAGYPSLWRRRSDMGEYPIVSTERNHTGSRSMHLAATATRHTTAILPDIVGCSTHRTLAFWANATSGLEGAMLIIGSMADIDDESTFHGIDTVTFTAIDTWRHHLTLLSATEGHLVMRLIGGGSETHLFIDDLCLDACAARNVRLGSVQQSSATLTWEGNGVTGVVARISGAISRIDTFYSSPAVIGGLSEDRTYYVNVEALCDCGGSGVAYAAGGTSNGNASNRTVTFSLNTLASASHLPICNSFEGNSTGTFPYNWRKRGAAVVSDLNYYDGGHSLSVDSGSYIILPRVSESGEAVVSFYAYSSAAGALSDSAILIGTAPHPDSAATMTVADTLHLDALGEWQPLAAHLDEIGGSFIVLRCGAKMYLDAFAAAQYGIAEAAVDGNGTVSWRQWNCTGVTIEYGPSGFSTGSGTSATATTSPFQPTGLDASLSYDFYLTPTGNSSGCQHVRLSLGNTTAIPYCEGFDIAPSDGMPQGWNIGRSHDGTPSIYTLAGNKTLHFKATASARSIAVLPALATSPDAQLTINMRSPNSNRAMLVVGEMANAADPNTFVPHDTLTCSASNVWQTLRLPLSRFTGIGRIALSCLATAQTAELWIDSLGISRGVTPSITAVSARRAQVSYPAGHSGYVEYGPAGLQQGEGTTLHITQSPHYINSLDPDSSYWFYCLYDSGEVTCLAPLRLTMPTEVSLPYCHQRDTAASLILPEFSVDSISSLHLYLDLLRGMVEVGVMERQGEWASFTAVDTLSGTSSWHVDFSSYIGNGRFIALRAMNGIFVVDHLKVVPCQLPTVTLEDDGTVLISGTGAIEYSGQRVAVVDSLRITDLADTTAYLFYPLCNTTDPFCGEPIQITTSMTVSLPYCADFTGGLPAGWAVEQGNASVSGGVLTLQQGAVVSLPIMPQDNVALEYEQQINGRWLRQQLMVQGRPRLRATNGRLVVRNLSADRCLLPQQLEVSQTGDGTLNVSLDSTYNDFYITYILQGESAGTTVQASTQPLALTLLPDTTYSFYLLCDTSTPLSCRQPQQVTTLATSIPVPYCTDFNESDTSASLPNGWRTLPVQSTQAGIVHSSGDGHLDISCNGSQVYVILPQPNIDSLRHLNICFNAKSQSPGSIILTLGTMSDAANSGTFDSLTSFALSAVDTRCFHALGNYYGAGRFIALRLTGNGSVNIDDLTLGTCAAYNVTMASHEADYVVFEWQRQGSPEVRIEYGPQGFGPGSGTVVLSTAASCRIDGLSPLTNYVFYITSSCPGQDSLCTPLPYCDTFYTFTPQGGTGCIDYTDLLAPYVSCGSGTYGNPTLTPGAIDYGYLSALSRHTVHYDTTERDPRTGGLLRTVPSGEASSVRLGNWLTGGANDPQAESITYALNVDSGDVDLLILQYAAVLQDPEHASTLQPRFRLEILNSDGHLIDSCGMAYFIANANLGWNLAAGDVLWKDWTTVGLDLTPYAGQTILIRLTTYDCGEGSHFGYAYFTLRCATKRMATEGCSDVPSNRFTVPTGFNYRWYTNLSDSTISTSNSILVPSDNSVTYYCHLSAIDNPSCGFDMSAFAGARYPLALFDTAISLAGCRFTLQLTDRSTISFDGHNPVGTGEPCESLLWLLPSGDTSTSANQTLIITDTGTVNVTLVAGIANNLCLDTLTQQIHISYPYPGAYISGDTERCHDDAPTLLTLHHAASFDWADTILGLQPDADTIVAAITVDTNGCTDTLLYPLVVHPLYNIADSDTVCASNLTYAWRDTSLAFTFADSLVSATLRRNSIYGCDSVMTISLSLWPSYDIHNPDTTCDNMPLPFFDTTLVTTGSYLHSDTTLHGCDSLVTMHLIVHPTFSINDPRQACDSLRWRDGNLYLADTMGATDSLLTTHGCDSVYLLHLNVFPSYFIADSDTVCASNLTYAWRDTSLSFTFAESLVNATLRRTSIHNCDSTMTIGLSLWPSYDIHHQDTTCDNLPLPFFDTTLVTTGAHLHSDTTLHGCDSLVTMHLMVHPTYSHTEPHEVCDSLRWLDGVLYLRDTLGPLDTLPSVHLCDSVLTLQLAVHPSYLFTEFDTFCTGDLYTFRNHTLTVGGWYADTLPSIHQCDSVLAIDLYERSRPTLEIVLEHDCDSARYLLHGVTNAPYHLWHWGTTGGRTEESADTLLYATPSKTVIYHIDVAYDDWPQCPVHDSIILRPFVKPRASLKVSPQQLSPEATSFDAYDNGSTYLYRHWYLDGVLQEETDWHLSASADPDADSIAVSLEVGTAHCADTTTAVILIRHQALFIPNAFTPDATDNNTFFVVGKGISGFEMSVFNRSGALVFHSDDIESPWDGRNLNGDACPMGSYVYTIRYSTVYQPQVFSTEVGTVILLR